MNKVKIIADSTIDLNPDYVKENDIEIVPLGVTFGDEVYLDGVDITVDELYKKVDECKKTPKTSAVSIATLTEVFKKYIDLGYDIFYTGISSKMSSSYQSAVIASQQFEEGRIFVLDSLNLSTGIGLQVVKAVELKNEGCSAKEIYEYLYQRTNKVVAQFLVEQLDYLHKGGRCSSLVHFFGKHFHIKPIIRVKDGSMYVHKKPIGKTINACKALMDIVKKELPNIKLDHIMLTSSYAPESEKILYEELCKIVDPSIITVTRAGCVISSHCGPGTIGILYVLKD